MDRVVPKVSTLARVQEGARRNGWIVMSSYQSRSDTLESVTLFALQALLDESDKRFSTDRRRLYLAGMSGTAKTLWKVVKPLKGSLAGMIGCAGGYSPELPPLTESVIVNSPIRRTVVLSSPLLPPIPTCRPKRCRGRNQESPRRRAQWPRPSSRTTRLPPIDAVSCA